MSVVTGIMLITSIGDEGERPIGEVHAWLAARRAPEKLIDVSDHAGGGKHPQFCSWSAGLNGFVDDEEFVAFVLSRDWREPENVILIMQPEEGPTSVFRPV